MFACGVRRPVALLGMVVGLLAASGAHATETVEVAGADGTVLLHLPPDWTAEVSSDDTFAWHATVTAPGVTEPFVLDVYVLPRGRHAIDQLWHERPAQAKRYRCDEDDVATSLEPVPHLTFEWSKQEQQHRALFAYVVRSRRCLTLRAEELDPAAWAVLREPLLGIAASMETALAPDPSDPPDYVQKIDSGIRFLAHPEVTAKQLTAVRKLVAAVRKDVASRHGTLTVQKENAPIVILHDTAERSRSVCAAAASMSGGQHFDGKTQRLFLVPPVDRADAAWLARAVTQFLLVETYGTGAPPWLFRGEVCASMGPPTTGKKLPALPPDFAPFPTQMPPFETQLGGADESLFWVLFFRYGPAAYRRAFGAFLDDGRATGDWDTATTTHLLALDQSKMQAAAGTFVTKKVKLIESE